MKNIFKFLGIFILIMLIGLSLVACSDGSGGSGDNNQTPVAGDYIFGNMSQIAGSVTAVTIIEKSGKSPGLVSNIKYSGDAAVPQTDGTYAVTFDVAAATGWNPATGLSAGNLIVSQVGVDGDDDDDEDVITGSDVTWTVHDAAAEQIGWNTICYGKGLFVAFGIQADVATSNNVMTSPNGKNWTIRQTPLIPDDASVIMSVCYSEKKDLFVAVGGKGTVMTSSDGMNWESRTAAENNNWNSVCYGNNLFVAVSANGENRVMSSPDGIVWTTVTAADNTINTIEWYSVCYGKGKFVATGETVMYSSNGTDWLKGTVLSGNYFPYPPGSKSVTYGKGAFVATNGYYPILAKSIDGINWYATSNGQQDFKSIAYGYGIFVAVGSSTINAVSFDGGITWGSMELERISWTSVCYGNNSFVAVAKDKTRVLVGEVVP